MEPKLLDQLLTKVGGKFKLVTLYQRRMRELVRGLPPLVEAEGADHWDTVAAEILEGKVDLIIGEDAERIRKDAAAREAEDVAAAEAKKIPAAAPAEKKS